MKLVLLTYAYVLNNPPEWHKKNPPSWNLVLENEEDAEKFFTAFSDKQVKQFWNFLGDRNPEHRNLLPDTKIHDYNDKNAISRYLNMYINTQPNGKRITLPELCEQVDYLTAKRIEGVLKILRGGCPVRISAGGGYSHMADFYHVYKSVECDEGMMRLYIFDSSLKCEWLMDYLLKKEFDLMCSNVAANWQPYGVSVKTKVSAIHRIGITYNKIFIKCDLTGSIEWNFKTFPYYKTPDVMKSDIKKAFEAKLKELCGKFFGLKRDVELEFTEYLVTDGLLETATVEC